MSPKGGPLSRLTPLVCLALLVPCCRRPQQQAAAKGGPSSPNTVAAYLTGAELQAEDDRQRLQVERALEDMLQRPAPVLQAQRYADYRGKQHAWSLIELLQHHFVPLTPITLDPQRFYQDVGQVEAKTAIEQQLANVKRAMGKSEETRP